VSAPRGGGGATAGRREAPRTNQEWTRRTTGALARAARREFARRGYAAASLEDIAAAAGVTKGAVYHHFGSKVGLFEAALRAVQADLVERIEARAGQAGEPLAAVVAGCEAFLDVALDDEARRIALLDGPSVLGWARWRSIDAEFGLGSLKEGLRACVTAGAIGGVDPDALAHLVSGALNEAVFLVAEADDRRSAHAKAMRALRALLRGLAARAP